LHFVLELWNTYFVELCALLEEREQANVGSADITMLFSSTNCISTIALKISILSVIFKIAIFIFTIH